MTRFKKRNPSEGNSPCLELSKRKERKINMKLDQVANSKNDEFFTPKYGVMPILKYIPMGAKVWCPFDTKDSLYVKMLEDKGCTVINTHIFNGEDFFELVNSEICDWCEYIVSNPPYSVKTEVLEKLFETEKPFAMLIGVVGLFESQKRFELFRDHEFEILYLNRRISFMKDYTSGKTALNPPFSSVYITSKILPDKVMFEEINKKEILVS